MLEHGPEPDPEPTPEELLWRARDAKRKEIYDKDIHHYYIDEQDAYVSNTLQVKDKCGRQEEVEVGGHLYASNILTVALDENSGLFGAMRQGDRQLAIPYRCRPNSRGGRSYRGARLS